jgi:TPR repeat protein
MRFFVYFYEGEEVSGLTRYSSVHFDAGVKLPRDANYARIAELCNQFNIRVRFAKAMLSGDSSKLLQLQMDFDIQCEPDKTFERATGLFLYMMSSFAENVLDTNTFRGDGCAHIHSEAVKLMWDTIPDPVKAAELYRNAAELGYAGSQNNLGDLYENGEGTKKSDLFAVYWYARAAERGEPTAYLSLATLFADRAVDDEMRIEAMKYAILAIERLPEGLNKETARRCYKYLQGVLSEEDLKLANSRADGWKPLYQELRLMSDTPRAKIQGSPISKSLH